MIFVESILYAASVASLLSVALAMLSGAGVTHGIALASLAGGCATGCWRLWQGKTTIKLRIPAWNGFEWALAVAFFLFVLRAFLWVVFFSEDEIRVLSPNNLGDLSLHLTYIREIGNGAPFWPDNPIYAHAKLTYPIGVDLLHSLFVLAGADVFRVFIWFGLAGSLGTFLALWRWGGGFTTAGFLFNGGLAGFAFFASGRLSDYQSTLAWKSIPLALLVTQRGLLFALPAGLLLLSSWRARYFSKDERHVIPIAGELLLYASMPLFHVHTFLFLSVLLFAWFIVRHESRWQIFRFVAAAFLPAALLMALITGGGKGPSVLGWLPGWMQSDPDFLKLCQLRLGTTSHFITIPAFWILNFGILPFLVVILLRELAVRKDAGADRAWVIPALLMFLICCFVKFAPWEWDNTKLMIWSYLVILPFLWSRVISRFSPFAIGALCTVLFFSGFVSLFGGVSGKFKGYEIASRSELDSLSDALEACDKNATFIANPDYNHPLLLLGRKLAMGYTGHVSSHGYEWREPQKKIDAIFAGDPNWRALAKSFGARYLFWGTREYDAFQSSPRPWRDSARLVASGEWGEIYDLDAPFSEPVAPSTGVSP